MTAIVVLPQEDGVIVLYDTAVIYPATGEIMSFVDKVSPYPSWRMVVAQSGLAGFADRLKVMMGNHISGMDQYEDLMRERAIDLHEQSSAMLGADMLEVGFCIAGWSGRREQWVALCASSYPKKTLNWETGELGVREPWELEEVGMWACNVPDREHLQHAGLDPDDMPGEFQRLDAREFGLRMMFAARRASGPREPTEESRAPYYLCGGQIVLMRLSANGCTQDVVYRWPDKVGDIVDLAQDPPMPTINVNRPGDTQQPATARDEAGSS